MSIATRIPVFSNPIQDAFFPYDPGKFDRDGIRCRVGAIELITLSSEITRVGECTEQEWGYDIGSFE
jgi:hypothetical protein